MIQSISSSILPRASTVKAGQTAPGNFSALMQEELQKKEQTRSNVEFSKHAIIRAEERGIEITPHLLDQLQDGMEKAQEKGATNILAMDAQSAFIINVPRARVITAISHNEMKENIFTNIDGAVFL